MTKKDFVHLHVHSEFSLQDSLLQTSDVVALAKRSGMWAAALTDVHNLFGAVKFYQAACKAGIKPIIGCELRMYTTHDMVSKQPLETPLAFRLIVLCQNAQGYKHLSCLLTRSYQSARVHGVAVVLPEWLQPENCEGLIAIEPGVHGYSAKSQLNDLQQLAPWQALFPGRYYVGLHRLGRVEEYQWEMHLAGLNKACKVPLVAPTPRPPHNTGPPAAPLDTTSLKPLQRIAQPVFFFQEVLHHGLDAFLAEATASGLYPTHRALTPLPLASRANMNLDTSQRCKPIR